MDSLLNTKDDNFNYFQTGKVRLCIKCINCMYILLLNAVAIKIQFLDLKLILSVLIFLSASLMLIFENTTSKAHVYVIIWWNFSI